MGVFLKKAARKALEKSSVTSSYAVIAVCVILVAANIIFFVMFPRLLSPVAIILSNVITMLITALAFRPINNLIQNTLIDRQEELTRKIAEEKAMTDRLAFLEDRNRELESKLDTRLQTESIPGEVNFTFKLEQMEYADATPSLSQAQRMRRLSQKQPLIAEEVYDIMSEVKGNQVEYVKIPTDAIRDYFSENTTVKQMQDMIVKAVEHYSKYLERQLGDRDAR